MRCGREGERGRGTEREIVWWERTRENELAIETESEMERNMEI